MPPILLYGVPVAEAIDGRNVSRMMELAEAGAAQLDSGLEGIDYSPQELRGWLQDLLVAMREENVALETRIEQLERLLPELD